MSDTDTYHDVLCNHGVQSDECSLARACLKVPQDYTRRANPSRTISLTLRLSKLPMLWVYSLFLASLAVFAWIEELFWFSQRPMVRRTKTAKESNFEKH